MTLEAGAKLSHYNILRALGAGGMGEVYLAHDTRLMRDVAVHESRGARDGKDATSARGHLQEGARIAERIAGKYIGILAVAITGALAGLVGDPGHAARFWGAAAQAHERMGVQIDLVDAKFLEPHFRRVREVLGEEAYVAAERQGCTVPYETALAETRAWLEGRG